MVCFYMCVCVWVSLHSSVCAPHTASYFSQSIYLTLQNSVEEAAGEEDGNEELSVAIYFMLASLQSFLCETCFLFVFLLLSLF